MNEIWYDWWVRRVWKKAKIVLKVHKSRQKQPPMIRLVSREGPCQLDNNERILREWSHTNCKCTLIKPCIIRLRWSCKFWFSFVKGENPDYQRKILSEHGRERTTNSTHIRRYVYQQPRTWARRMLPPLNNHHPPQNSNKDKPLLTCDLRIGKRMSQLVSAIWTWKTVSTLLEKR